MKHLAAVGLVLICGFQLLWSGNVVHLKTRALEPDARSDVTSKHLILQFNSPPGPRLLAELAHRRIRVLAFLPDSALMVACKGTPDLSRLDIRWAGPMAPGDKLSPALSRDASGVYLVMFHQDVESDLATALVTDRGLQILENPGLMPGHVLVSGDRDRVLALASYDPVAYILPARTELALRRRVYYCPGAVTPAGTIADYALASSGWPADSSGHVTLQYFFEGLTQKLDPNTVKSEIERAFTQWGRYTNVTFTAASQSAAARSVDILFATGAHGDAYPFTDSSVLAHTFYPAPPNAEPVAGDMHFNDVENWGVGSSIDLFSVALHEAGHALGLGHSDNPDAVMYPYYKQSTGLSSDDIAAIQSLYGSLSQKPIVPVTPPVTTPVSPPVTPPVTPPANPTVPPSGGDATPPAITITSPAFTIMSTAAASFQISGTAADNIGVVSVQWSVSTGSSGTAAGTSNWSANIPLLVGTNTVTVRAFDAAGNCGWRALTIVRQ